MIHALVVVTVVILLVQHQLFVATVKGKRNNSDTKTREGISKSVDPGELPFITPRVSNVSMCLK